MLNKEFTLNLENYNSILNRGEIIFLPGCINITENGVITEISKIKTITLTKTDDLDSALNSGILKVYYIEDEGRVKTFYLPEWKLKNIEDIKRSLNGKA